MSIQYDPFFRAYVLRKRSELMNPKFYGLAEIKLPRNSLYHFMTADNMVMGPSNQEAFVSNYDDKINIEFDLKYLTPLGRTRPLVFDVRKAIDAYRKGHYRYIWVRNPAAPLKMEKELFVVNHAMMLQTVHYQPNKYTNFEKAYNQLNTLIHSVKDNVARTGRHQFIRFELPPTIPSYIQFDESFKKYKAVIDKDPKFSTLDEPTIKYLKGYGAYWLMDWFAFLIGDYKYSQFGLMTEEELSKLHIVLTFNSRCLILKMDLFKGWLDQLNKEEGVVTPQRINATKRSLLVIINLLNNGVIENTELEENGQQSTQTVQALGTTEEGESGGGDTASDLQGQTVASKGQSEETDSDSGSMLDLFMDAKAGDGPSAQTDGNPTNDADPEGDWTAEVDDALLETVEVEEVESNTKKGFDTPIAGIELALEARAKEGSLTVSEQNFFIKRGNRYKTIELPNGQTIEQFIKIDPKVLRKIDKVVAPDMPTILDKSMLESTVTKLKSDYVKELYHKDLIACVLQIQNAGVALVDFNIESISDVNGGFEVIKPAFHPVDGLQKTSPIRMPRISDDGTFTVDGVKQYMQLQKVEIPIRKINEFKVALTSYYGRRLMVSRSRLVADDYAESIGKQIKLKAEFKELKVTLGNVFNNSIKSPRSYSIFAKQFKAIVTKDYEFNFDFANLQKTYPDLIKVGNQDAFPIGVKDGKVLEIDSFGNVTLDKKPEGHIEQILGVISSKLPIESVVININGYLFPIGVVLCFYFGIDKLLKVLKVDYRTVPMGEKPKLSSDEYALAFNDEYLIFNRHDKLTGYVFGGLRKLPNLGNFSRIDLNNPGVWVPIIADARVKPSHFKEMKNIFDLFIDPMTREELIRLKYPTSFEFLLIEAVKLLLTDQTKHEVSVEEQRFVGYERMAGALYGELVKGVKQYRNKPAGRKSALEINPEAVMMKVLTDTSVNLVEEANPIHYIKMTEEYTYGGNGGRSEITMTKRTRGQLVTDKGVLSEAGKDSGKVGYVHYLTTNAKVVDLRGNVDINVKDTNSGLGSVSMNLLTGDVKDDSKRSLFSSVFQSQTIGATNYTAGILRTGYEDVIAHRTSELYSKVAKQNGVVESINDYGLVVKYADGTKDNYPMGLVIGEASGEYHRHTRVTDLKVGESFKAGEIIGWDEMFFERSLLNPRQVSWKAGIMTLIALCETQFTYEDSVEIDYEWAEKATTPFLKPKRFMVLFEQTVNMQAKIGDHVEYETILCDVEDAHVSQLGDDKQDYAGLVKMGIRQIKSNHHGKIVKIDVTYNGDPADMSPSLRALVEYCDKERVKLNKITNSGIVHGNIGGNTTVRKPPINPGTVAFAVYVEELTPTIGADKVVVGNQMKGTVGNVWHNPVYTKDGRRVYLKFSCKGMFNRNVLSLRDKMCTNELSIGVSKQAVAIYRGH